MKFLTKVFENLREEGFWIQAREGVTWIKTPAVPQYV